MEEGLLLLRQCLDRCTAEEELRHGRGSVSQKPAERAAGNGDRETLAMLNWSSRNERPLDYTVHCSEWHSAASSADDRNEDEQQETRIRYAPVRRVQRADATEGMLKALSRVTKQRRQDRLEKRLYANRVEALLKERRRKDLECQKKIATMERQTKKEFRQRMSSAHASTATGSRLSTPGGSRQSGMMGGAVLGMVIFPPYAVGGPPLLPLEIAGLGPNAVGAQQAIALAQRRTNKRSPTSSVGSSSHVSERSWHPN